MEASIETLKSDVQNLRSQHIAQHQLLQQAEAQRSSNQEAVLQEVDKRARSIEQVHQEAERAHKQRSNQQAVSILDSVSGFHESQLLLQESVTGLRTVQQQADRTHNRRIDQQEASILDSVGGVHARQLSLEESVTDLRTVQQRLELKLDTVIAAQIAGTAESTLRRHVSSATTPTDLSKRPCPALPTQIEASLAAWCPHSCTCICHRYKAHRTPKYLQNFFGVLFLGHSGIPMVKPTCDESGCLAHSRPALLFTYVFPAWILARAFLITARFSLSCGLELTIRLPRVLHESSKIWIFAEHGDINGVKDLLQKRAVTLYDTSSALKYTILMVNSCIRIYFSSAIKLLIRLQFAVTNSHWDLAEILMLAGADPHQQNSNGEWVLIYFLLNIEKFTDLDTDRSTVDLVWKKIFSGSLENSVSQRLQVLFPAKWWVESQELNIIHRTVLGLNSLKLDDLLASVPYPMINSGDVKGRTPLWWAAHKDDYSAISSLLKYNADVSKASYAGWSALSLAIWSKNQPCIRLLLQNSPNLNQRDSGGWLALHHAVESGLDADIVEATIPPGTDISVRTMGNKNTALMLATQWDQHHTCECVLSLGGDINAINAIGETALHNAIQYKSHKSLQLLLRRNPDIHIKTQAGETFLHFAAQHADIESLQILHAFGLRGLYTKDTVTGTSPTQIHTNVIDLTALEIAEQRTDVTPEWLAMFRKLMHKVEFPDDPVHTNGEDDGAEFYDALESQER